MDSRSPASPPRPRAIDPSFYEGRDLDALTEVPNYHSWILEYFESYLRGRVIEVGAGTGNIAAHYVEHVDELLLVEPAQNLYPRLQARFAGQAHVQTRCTVLDSLWSDELVRKESSFIPFDAAVLVNVLEHVSDHLQMLKLLNAMLRQGGALLLFVPAMPWIYGTLDRSMQHVRRYNRKSLRRLVEEAGFKLQHIRYFDFAGVIPWFIAGRVLRRRSLSVWSVQVYDQWIVPLARLLEHWVAPPIGKNLICIAQKL